MDRVLVNSLHLSELTLSPAPWTDHKQQLALVDVAVKTDTSKAGASDNLEFSTSYAAIAKHLRNHFSIHNFPPHRPLSAYSLAEESAKQLLFHLDPPLSKTDSVSIAVRIPEALLHGGKLVAKTERSLQDYSPIRQLVHDSQHARNDSLSIQDFHISTVIGLNDCERLQEQPLVVEIETWPNFDGIQPSQAMAWNPKILQEFVWKVGHALMLSTPLDD
jgi:dihydroneopterin aldolase